MSMYNVVFYCCLCLICQTSGQNSVDTGFIEPYILCEGRDSPSIACPTATFIKIKDAIYGRTNRSTCKHGPIKTDSCNKTVITRVENMCNSNQRCLPKASNVMYGDPCPNTYKYLNVTYRCIKNERLSSKSSTHLTTLFFTSSPRSSPTSEHQESSSKTGIAVGISVTLAVIIAVACVLIILRKRKRTSKKQSAQSPTNDKDYIGTQNVAMPWSGDSLEYNDLKVQQESHKYGEIKSVNEATGNSCYDVIDANEHQWKTKAVSVKQGIFQNDSSSIPCQEYAMLDPNEKWNTEPKTSPYRDTGCDNYTVLEAEETTDNSPMRHQTKNNEKKLEVTSANNAKRDNYIVLDPELTGFNRMNDTGNDKFGPSVRDMKHDTTHHVKENTNCYELAKPVLEDGKENTRHKYDGDYGFCQDSDYQLNAGHPTYSEEHVYNHTVDDVYDTTSHNKKCTATDNTYDYFSGDQTDDDYNIPMKM